MTTPLARCSVPMIRISSGDGSVRSGTGKTGRPRHALVVGRRVFLRRPAPRDCEEFLQRMRDSRSLQVPWSPVMTTPDEYAAFLRRGRQKNRGDVGRLRHRPVEERNAGDHCGDGHPLAYRGARRRGRRPLPPPADPPETLEPGICGVAVLGRMRAMPAAVGSRIRRRESAVGSA